MNAKPEDLVDVFVTCASVEEAKKIGKKLVQDHSVACANIIPKVLSFYYWEGKLEEDSEALLIMKTRKSLVSQVQQKVKALHSYEIPAIIVLPILEGFQGYLEWVLQETMGS